MSGGDRETRKQSQFGSYTIAAIAFSRFVFKLYFFELCFFKLCFFKGNFAFSNFAFCRSCFFIFKLIYEFEELSEHKHSNKTMYSTPRRSKTTTSIVRMRPAINVAAPLLSPLCQQQYNPPAARTPSSQTSQSASAETLTPALALPLQAGIEIRSPSPL